MRVRDGGGKPALLVISVRADDGTVRASLGTTSMILDDPAAVSKLVDLYRLAQAVALWDRGRW